MNFKFSVIVFLSHLVFACHVFASVSGQCSLCHTMHNSQSGDVMAEVGTVGTYAGWNASNQLTGGTITTPEPTLLISDCVGCHSSSTTDSIITIDTLRIPIVFNTVAAPTNPLAGGNFFWVVDQGDEYGHNVRGISAQDANLASAPGTIGCANSCHVTLTLEDSETDLNRANGCKGCHQGVKHHGIDQGVGKVVTAEAGWYRFLDAPAAHAGVGGAPVYGIEDPNWEQTPDKDNHNVYYGGTGDDNETPQSIGKFCSGCHYNFHSDGDNTNVSFWSLDNGGTGSDSWLRHPADSVIPNSDEYVNYTVYTVTIPVGRPETAAALEAVTMDVVRPGTDKVICMSCHRAHGSPYPDMLRWDYDAMVITTGTPAAAGEGCFKCHSAKDD